MQLHASTNIHNLVTPQIKGFLLFPLYLSFQVLIVSIGIGSISRISLSSKQIEIKIKSNAAYYNYNESRRPITFATQKKFVFIISILLGLDEQNVSNSVYYTLIILYALVIGLGVAGNSMILWGILSKSAMRTARNYFIVR